MSQLCIHETLRHFYFLIKQSFFFACICFSCTICNMYSKVLARQLQTNQCQWAVMYNSGLWSFYTGMVTNSFWNAADLSEIFCFSYKAWRSGGWLDDLNPDCHHLRFQLCSMRNTLDRIESELGAVPNEHFHLTNENTEIFLSNSLLKTPRKASLGLAWCVPLSMVSIWRERLSRLYISIP